MNRPLSVAERARVLDGEDRAQTIRDRLRDAIVERRLSPGTKLSEAEIGELFKVSRTVTRAALQMLAFEGLVHTERNRGAFVSSPSPEDAAQIFASRRLIEPGIVAAAVERFGKSDAPLFRRQLDEQRRLVELHSPAARRAEIQASGDFHLLLAEVAGNAILKKFMAELVARSSLVIALYGRSGVSSCGYDDHSRILDAVEALDAAKATKLMLQHINHIEADLDLRARDEIALKDALLIHDEHSDHD